MTDNHSHIGASSCSRWWNCPGSVKLSLSAPASKPSKYAAEGTVAHKVAEAMLKGEPYELMYEQDGWEFEVTDEMVEAAEMYRDTILDDLREAGLPKEALSIEKRFHLVNIDRGAFGTNDCCLEIPFNKIIIYDFKYGAGVPVEVEGNKQLMYYALGAIEGLDVPNIELVVVQPRAYHEDSPVRRWRLSLEELEVFAADLKIHIEDTRKENPAFKSGSWCRWCPASPICTVQEYDTKITCQTDFKKIPPAVEMLSPEDICTVMEKKQQIEDWLESVQAYAQQLAERGTQIPGHKLVKKITREKFIDPVSVEEKFEYVDTIYTKKLKTPKQIRELFGSDALDGLVEKPDGGLTLVGMSDRRKPVEITPEFTKIENKKN